MAVIDFGFTQTQVDAEGALPVSRQLVGLGTGCTTVYLMRAFKTTPTTGYIHWASALVPDVAADKAPVPAGDLSDIVVDMILIR